MKHIQLFLLLSFTLFFAQKQQFIYEYRFVPDSTDRSAVRTEFMALNINSTKSEFYGLERFKSDSAMLADSKKGIFSMPPNKEMIGERVIKYPNSSKLSYIKILDEKYIVEQDVKLNWNLKNEFKTIMSYKAQKATTEFGGRRWIAWFTSGIPFQDGPYKFSGLPGLILELEDSTHSHIFTIKGMKDTDEEFIYPNLNNYKEIKITYPQFVKVFKTNRKNPVASLIGKIPDQTDSSGKFTSGQQMLKEIETMRLEQFKKDNNIIEINLLR
ncbi:GLPGLI family protein [Chryseobacterium arachidis]|uniref:GLPGLI family protein n=1 Tax=Chryseobacterium arachidis TaxID=1416778 RepID=A0A1M4TYX2_9FLAO|nr:GLPGLI family protein [Chryseobacterium arachidis]SHE49659.1 GLPGLI family protein [Chryseobacterium arachidis]